MSVEVSVVPHFMSAQTWANLQAQQQMAQAASQSQYRLQSQLQQNSGSLRFCSVAAGAQNSGFGYDLVREAWVDMDSGIQPGKLISCSIIQDKLTSNQVTGEKMFKVGDRVRRINDVANGYGMIKGGEYEVSSSGATFVELIGVIGQWYNQGFDLITKETKTMFGTVTTDLKKFVAEHKSTIYVIAVCILADHLLFQGAFRERLQKIMNQLLGKVEAAVNGSASSVTAPFEEKKNV